MANSGAAGTTDWGSSSRLGPPALTVKSIAPAPTPDRPAAFGWRGLLLDVCRHWIPPAAIHRTIDAMGLAGFNVLHLHLTDDQAHRVESRAWPRLHTVAEDGAFLTRSDVTSIVEHAGEVGIAVIPELDMPGHTTAWLAAYPHLAAAGTQPPTTVRHTIGIAEVAIDPEADTTFEFVGALIDEFVEYFPDYRLHLGGDEVHANAWPGRVVAEAQPAFTDRVVAMALQRGRTPVVWDEAFHPDLDRRVIVQVWRGHRRLWETAALGHPVVFSTPYYLDLSYAPIHLHVSPTATPTEWAAARTRLWSDPLLSRVAPLLMGGEQFLDSDRPEPPDSPDAETTARILGGEACMWTELCPEELLDLRLWPEAAAVAKVLRGDSGALDAWLDAFESDLLTVGIDLAAQRRARFVKLAGGDEELADDLATLARCCVRLGWYGQHTLRDDALHGPYDRFVDALSTAPTVSASDPAVTEAASRLLDRTADSTDDRLLEVRAVAQKVLEGDEPIDVVGEVVIARRPPE